MHRGIRYGVSRIATGLYGSAFPLSPHPSRFSQCRLLRLRTTGTIDVPGSAPEAGCIREHPARSDGAVGASIGPGKRSLAKRQGAQRQKDPPGPLVVRRNRCRQRRPSVSIPRIEIGAGFREDSDGIAIVPRDGQRQGGRSSPGQAIDIGTSRAEQVHEVGVSGRNGILKRSITHTSRSIDRQPSIDCLFCELPISQRAGEFQHGQPVYASGVHAGSTAQESANCLGISLSKRVAERVMERAPIVEPAARGAGTERQHHRDADPPRSLAARRWSRCRFAAAWLFRRESACGALHFSDCLAGRYGTRFQNARACGFTASGQPGQGWAESSSFSTGLTHSGGKVRTCPSNMM